MHGMDSMVNEKKMQALKDLIALMFQEENLGTESVDVEQALHESMETPEEEAAEHAGGISEEEENAMEGPDEDLKETMAKFMKQGRKMPVKGKTKGVILATESAPAKKFITNKSLR